MCRTSHYLIPYASPHALSSTLLPPFFCTHSHTGPLTLLALLFLPSISTPPLCFTFSLHVPLSWPIADCALEASCVLKRGAGLRYVFVRGTLTAGAQTPTCCCINKTRQTQVSAVQITIPNIQRSANHNTKHTNQRAPDSSQCSEVHHKPIKIHHKQQH